MKLIGCVKWTLGIYYHNRGENAMGVESFFGEERDESVYYNFIAEGRSIVL